MRNDPASTTDSTTLDPRLLALLAGLRVRAQQVVDGYMMGEHRGRGSGAAIEFAEHRPYVPGDDPRGVDWRVYGRTDRLYLKRFEQETDLECQLLVDLSASMTYRGERAGLSKLDYAKTVAAAIAYLVLRQRDAVGMMAYDDRVRRSVRAARRATHWQQLIDVLESAPEGERTATAAAMDEAAGRMSRRGVVFVFSDFVDRVDEVLEGLRRLRIRGHQVTAVQLFDPDEVDFRGLEAGEGTVMVEPETIREAYLKRLGERIGQIEAGCHRQEIHYARLVTDHPLDEAVRACLLTD